MKKAVLFLVLLCWLSGYHLLAAEFKEETYKKADGYALKLRIYQDTSSPNTKRPAIVFFFGGGWSKGSPEQFHEHCKHLAAKGFIAMSADYRVESRQQSKPWDSTKDALDAIDWIRSNAKRLKLDPSRLAAGGGSAGGHLAAATATLPEHGSRPNALLLFNPALNLLYKTENKNKWNATEEQFEAISPFHHLDKGLPPTVIFHGDNDDAVPYPSIVEFVSKATKLGNSDITLHTYKGRPHGFFNFGRQGGKDYKDTIKKTDAFFKKLGWMND